MTDTAAPSIDTATDLPIRRPHANQYLAGNYAPVEAEVTAHDLPIVGEIPAAASADATGIVNSKPSAHGRARQAAPPRIAANAVPRSNDIN